LVRDFVTPNGLAFSPDESTLYINDTRRQHIRAFDIQPDGLLALASDRVLCDLSGDKPGVPDGMKVDIEGNLYCGGSGGIWVLNKEGKHLGTIDHGESSTTNVAFGGEDRKSLFFTTWNTVGRIEVTVPGLPVPSQKMGK
jgi:gluconolactonase